MGIQLWTRRTWKWVLPLALFVQVLAMQNVQPVGGSPWPGWHVDLAWMLSAWGGATLLLSPVLAGAACAIVVTQANREIMQVTDPLGSRRRALKDIAASIWIQGLLIQGATLIAGLAICLSHNATTHTATLPWQILNGPIALLAAVLLGTAIGGLLETPWSVVGTTIGLFLAHRINYWWAYPELFTLESATWFVEDHRPTVSLARDTWWLNAAAAVAILGLTWFLFGMRQPRRRSWLALVVALVALVACAWIYLPYLGTREFANYEPIQ